MFNASIQSRRVYIIYLECVYVWPQARIYCVGGDIELCGDNSNTSTKDKGNDGNNNDLQSSCRKSRKTFYTLYINQDSDFNRLQNSWEVVKSNLTVGKHFTMSALTEGNQNYIVSFCDGYIFIYIRKKRNSKTLLYSFILAKNTKQVINGGYCDNKSIHEVYTTGIYDTSLACGKLKIKLLTATEIIHLCKQIMLYLIYYTKKQNECQ